MAASAKSVDEILCEFDREIKEVRWEFRPRRTSAALAAGRLKVLCRCYGAMVSRAEEESLKQAS